MDTKPLEKFSQSARRQLHEQVAAKLESVLRTDSAELRGQAAAIDELKRQIDASSRQAVIERVAYTWFNRFCALRFMDVTRYTRMGVVSPAAGFSQPEILQEAKQGLIDTDLAPFVKSQAVFDLLGGRVRSRDPQGEAYRLLLVATCNAYHEVMPFLFERIDDYTELLMPDDLLSAGSILQGVRDAMTPERLPGCRDHRLALPVLHLRKEGPGHRLQAEDQGRRHPRRHPAFHAALDRALPGRELPGPALDAQPPQLPAG